MLGTFVEITLFTEAYLEEAVTSAFEAGLTLEKIFNIHDPSSEISLLNRSSRQSDILVHPSLLEVQTLAQKIYELSEGAFNPWRQNHAGWDLSGIAKGYIVDKMVENLLESMPSISGMINAGGDLRYFNCSQRVVNLRLGDPRQPVLRELNISYNAIATSSPGISLIDKKSSTKYSQPLREGLSAFHSISALADECVIADALTKVGLFAKAELVQKCASVFNAQVIIFDSNGQPIEVFE